jgi:hypothetical protein
MIVVDHQLMSETLRAVAGAWTLALALFGGAGASALLEMCWRPWRTRKRVASVLANEVNINAQMLVLQTHLRKKYPRRIPADFELRSGSAILNRSDN